MKLSTIYSALLTALALGVSAGPIPEVSGLEVIDTNAANIHVPRAPPKTPAVVPTKTKRYEVAVAAARRNLAPGWYAFTIEWDLPAAVEGNFESKTELEVLQRKLGFEHVAVVAGEIVEKKTGRGKNEKIELDFNGYFMDLIKKEDKVTSTLRGPRALDARTPLKPGQTLVYAKQTTAAKGSSTNMNKLGKAYFAEAGHQKYSVDSNNCATFRDAILKSL
ncbi:hypothetical protein OPT61_g7075 [Boeremia exigua]|uniref:Uncharacterized protein n=1 Tax=Boeremia exigua TaxID=749465 RepID=A0ACC2I4P6_9PLEO|nr:hypothetical protein OPT61_g7075 [Boeremia exigua]